MSPKRARRVFRRHFVQDWRRIAVKMSSNRARSKTDVLQGRLPLDCAKLAPGAIRFRQSKAPGATQQNVVEKRPFQIVHTCVWKRDKMPGPQNVAETRPIKNRRSSGRGAFRFRQSTGARHRAISTKCGQKMRLPNRPYLRLKRKRMWPKNAPSKKLSIPAFETKRNAFVKKQRARSTATQQGNSKWKSESYRKMESKMKSKQWMGRRDLA